MTDIDPAMQASELVESAPLPASTVTLIEGAAFAILGSDGDVSGAPVEGVFVGDTRICSRSVLSIDDRAIDPLTFTVLSPSSAIFAGRSDDRRFLVLREVHVGSGMRVEVRIRNLHRAAAQLTVRMTVEADLAHVFAVKRGEPAGPSAPCDAGRSTIRFGDPAGQHGAIIRGSHAMMADAQALRWDLLLGPGETWHGCIEFSAVRQGEPIPMTGGCGEDADRAQAIANHPAGREVPRELPSVRSDLPGLTNALRRSQEDLAALRLVDPHHPEDVLTAAGAPWYMTLFGRDSILTSWMALPFDQRLALGSLRALARMQGVREDTVTEEQPGKILHEVRFSPGASLALSDGNVYFGTVDATPLFVMLVHELWRWGASRDDIAALQSAVDAALGWLEGPGDVDGDGYVEYAPPPSAALGNQGWKDSHDAIAFSDGRLARSPVALAEVQAYAYGAWRAGAAMARAYGHDAIAAARDRRANDLRSRFERDFWLADAGAFAIGLDAEKRPIDAVASNMGHCLWTGIVADRRKAGAVARWLVSPELFNGWGVRTLATSMARYNPLSYHNGSVWPHDTAICIEGLRRYGFVDEAQRIALGLIDAAAALEGRLPELFAGLTRTEMPIPVRYPTSCSPQAWASAASMLVVRSLLALDPNVPAGQIELDPTLPPSSSELVVSGIALAGTQVTIDVERDAIAVRNLPRGLAVLRPANARRDSSSTSR